MALEIIKRLGKSGSGLLLIMPYNSEIHDLGAHLRFLDRQSMQDFDVLVVAEAGSAAAPLLSLMKQKPHGFGIILGKKKERTGSAGAFFEGQKYALENGYSCMIHADVDCVPIDRQVVSALYKEREGGYASARVIGVRGGIRHEFAVPSPNHYTLFSEKTVRKYGLYYLPLFYYAEDGEYRERVKQRRVMVPFRVTHPFKMEQAFERRDRAWYVQVNTLCAMREASTIVPSILMFAALFWLHAFFMTRKNREAAIRALSLLLSFSFGKKALDSLSSLGLQHDSVKCPADAGYGRVSFASKKYAGMGLLGKLASMAGGIFEGFRKRLVVESHFSYSWVALRCAFAREVYVKKTDGGCVQLCDNGGVLRHTAKLVVASALFLPIMAAIILAYAALKAARQPKTMGYGLSEIRGA